MQGMPMNQMHNTFWRENQVVVTFHSTIPLVSTDGMYQGAVILEKLDLEMQRQKLNTFLMEHGLHYTLRFYRSDKDDGSQGSHPMVLDTQEPGAAHTGRSDFTLPTGVYLFGLSRPIQSVYGEVVTSITTFFDFSPVAPTGMTGMSSEMEDMPGMGNTDGSGDGNPTQKNNPVVPIVNAFNRGLEMLNNDQKVPISATSPNWLWGNTTFVPQGCPLDPPVPLDDDCSFWHFELPQLSPEPLRAMTGEGVTVFVLDTLPELSVIEHAVTKAGDDNLLLFDVSRNVTFNYNIWNEWVAGGGDPNIPALAVGKDVYGRHFAFKMADHGLFIAGIIHDISPHARVECIRVMGDFCVGDSDLFLKAMYYIQDRLLPGGDLYQRPVVINMSLVMPTMEEAQSEGLDSNVGGVTNDVLTHVRQAIQTLVQRGAIIAASAGNEADLRENPTGMRPPALHPAAFANPPDSIHQIIPVGAVKHDGTVTSYSCYPGARGIATYGGEIPTLNPSDPPSSTPKIITYDAMKGIYSAGFYPPMSEDPPALEYPPPNDHGWSRWIGTSFATPIISAVAARVLDWQTRGGSVLDVPDAIIAAGGTIQTLWDHLDPTTGVAGGSIMGPMLTAVQKCQAKEDDDDDK